MEHSSSLSDFDQKMSIFDNDQLFKGFQDEEDERSSSDISDDDDDKYKKEAERLKIENENLKRSLRVLSKPCGIKVRDSNADGPVAHVILFNNNIARKYRGEVLDFFHELSGRMPGDADYSAVSDPQPTFIQYTACRKQFSSIQKQSSKRAHASLKAFQAFSSVQIYKKFFTDQLGEPLSFQDPELSEWLCPDYDTLSSEPLSGDPDNPTLRRKKLNRICFNCGESDHQMKECPKSRNHRAINQRRQKFNEEVAKYSEGSPQIRLGGPRYHADEEEKENQSRFALFKPGVISSDLQEALGITDEHIPQYVYQMRKLGYPPGHLRNAQITNSGLSLYNECSKKSGKRKDDEYVPVDVNKLIGYPGFNIPPLPGQVDNFQEFGVPPMDERQSKEVMISYFEHRNNLRKQQDATEAKEKIDIVKDVRTDVDIEEVDMEMGDDEERVIEDEEMEDGEVDDDASDQGIVVEVGDLTEDELEIKREMLLKELGQSSESKRDSDYRDVKSNDQDYRIKRPEIIDLTVTSESEQEWSGATRSCLKDTDDRRSDTPVEVPLAVDTSLEEKAPENCDRRKASSDTDYRMNGNSLTMLPCGRSDKNSTNTSPAQKKVSLESNSDIESPIDSLVPSCDSPLPASSSESCAVDQKLPGREKFAEGITQFDAYYSQSKSSGMYEKLRTLLKDSPQRQEK